jgi:aryl-alcohol dehydrogenase-like predicted oxidoreductase
MQYGTSKQMEWTIPEEKALPIIKYAFDRGINTWDTVEALRPLTTTDSD